MIEMITNKEIQARKERTTLEVFDVQNSFNEVIDPSSPSVVGVT